MTVTYETTIDLATREDVHKHASTVYGVQCPECRHSFRLKVPAGG